MQFYFFLYKLKFYKYLNCNLNALNFIQGGKLQNLKILIERGKKLRLVHSQLGNPVVNALLGVGGGVLGLILLGGGVFN